MTFFSKPIRSAPYRVAALVAQVALGVVTPSTAVCASYFAPHPHVSYDTFKVGDAVEAWNITWYKGRIVEIGTGKENTADYLVDFDDFKLHQWFKAKNVRALQAPKEYAGPPRAGKYLVMSYGNPRNPLPLGYFLLKGGSEYRFYTLADKLIGSGTYRFDAAAKLLTWVSGPFKESRWDGKFEITREGKSHTIRFNRTTLGTNSTDERS
jgi:hypothetical protein